MTDPKTPVDCECAKKSRRRAAVEDRFAKSGKMPANRACGPSHIGKVTLLVFMLALCAIGSCASLDSQLQAEIEVMADTIETRLDPALPASFETAAKSQARETVKYAETNDPLLRRNVREMLDTIENDLDPAITPAELAELVAHAKAVIRWLNKEERPPYFDPAPDTEPANGP